jgi:hypothetical protein
MFPFAQHDTLSIYARGLMSVIASSSPETAILATIVIKLTHLAVK